MRQPPEQIQFPFYPPQHLVRWCKESDVSQPPQISHHRSAQVAQEARVRHEEVYHENQPKRCGPGRDLVIQDGEVRVDAIGLHRFVAEQEEYPHAGPDRGTVEVEHEALEEGVEAAWEEAEGAGEEEEGHDGSVLGFEAFEEWGEGEGVQHEMEEVPMEKGVGIEAVYWRHVSLDPRDAMGEVITCIKTYFLWNQSAPLGERGRE